MLKFNRFSYVTQDLGDKLRLVVVAHRRVKITGQLYEDIEPLGPKG